MRRNLLDQADPLWADGALPPRPQSARGSGMVRILPFIGDEVVPMTDLGERLDTIESEQQLRRRGATTEARDDTD